MGKRIKVLYSFVKEWTKSGQFLSKRDKSGKSRVFVTFFSNKQTKEQS